MYKLIGIKRDQGPAYNNTLSLNSINVDSLEREGEKWIKFGVADYYGIWRMVDGNVNRLGDMIKYGEKV